MLKKRPTLILSIFLSNLLFSQGIDESFIKSLPANLQNDFLKQASQPEDSAKNIPNPETRIQNLEQALEDAKKILNDLEYELKSSDEKTDNELARFGENFFQSFQSTFLPINQPNPDSNYVLDFGDELTVQLVGQTNNTYTLRIQRNGAINLPNYGEIFLAGKSLLDAITTIKTFLSQAFIGVEAFISLSQLRDINVLIVGNVTKPGMYTLSGGSSPLALIHAAGGIDSHGSFRSISHKRNNTLIQNVDLYKILVDGDMLFNNYLRSGDVLIVHPRKNEIVVSGNFANPGIYESLDGETIFDIIKPAGPLLSHSSGKLNLKRLENGVVTNLSIPINDSNKFKLFDGDAISLLGSEPKFNKVKEIKISGEVLIPGKYSVNQNTTLAEIIKEAGYYTKNAYPLGGIFMRESIKELELEAAEKSYNELVRYLVASPNFATILSSPDSRGILTFLSLLKDYQPSGRIVTEFSLSELDANQSLNRILEDGDSIYIPAFSPDVYVFGEVLSPGASSFSDLASPDYYIKKAGGFNRVADTERVLIIAPNGVVSSFAADRISFFKEDITILPGSTIYVPRQLGKLEGVNLATTVAPIVSSLALSLASLNSIND